MSRLPWRTRPTPIFLGFAADGIIHFPHADELESQHPVAEIVEEKDNVIVVLECLAFHAWNGFEVFFRVALIKEAGYLVFHEARQFDVERRVARRATGPARV